MVLSAEEYKGKYLYYAKMAKINFMDVVHPGCVLELKAAKKAQADNIVMCTTEASVDGKVIFTGEIHFMIVEG